MKVVVDIDENIYTRLFDNDAEDYTIINDDLYFLAKAIRKGEMLQQTGYYQEKYNHTMQQINKLAQMMHDNALMFQSLLDHDAQGKINPYADIERWMNMIFDEDFL